MANVLRGRGMSLALALWSAYVATWMVLTESGPGRGVAWWLAGVVCAALLLPTYRLASSGTPAPSPALPGDVEVVPVRAAGHEPAGL
ncbi:hypothetical protein [Gaiella sp.]|jgi:hypothetical protein|uniref:hypothetical protein n=1 Tax=Gaiella sp. TaxID=2663207 RepID=UPI002E30BC81|nr:hypothetical protein [Gaiella sp.]